jgi:UTP--glucose-1-phosphate uridylyltransferase
MVRKAVIPAAGLGTRFLPATKAQPKEMLPLVDKPAIQYVVEEAVRAGITDILIITGRGKRTLEDHFDRSFELEFYLAQAGREREAAEMRHIAELADIHYVRQAEPKGLGHAVGVARSHVGDEPFAVLLGDDLMAESATVLGDMVAASEKMHASVIALKPFPPEEISAYGCVAAEALDDGGPLVRVTGLVEKPPAEEAPSNLAIMGRYVLTPEIFDCIDRVKPGRGGEIQLTDAMSLLLERESLYGFTFTDGRYDTGNKLDWLRATVELALVRDDLGPGFRKYLTELCRREGLA